MSANFDFGIIEGYFRFERQPGEQKESYTAKDATGLKRQREEEDKDDNCNSEYYLNTDEEFMDECEDDDETAEEDERVDPYYKRSLFRKHYVSDQPASLLLKCQFEFSDHILFASCPSIHLKLLYIVVGYVERFLRAGSSPHHTR